MTTPDLPDLARFLRKWRSARDLEAGVERAVAEDAATTERRLRWLLVENPVARDGQHGYCVRDQSGAIRGIDVAFPSAFVAGSERTLALCSGAFFVDPEARSLGLFLFKKYLTTPGYAFYFATTCNENSGPVWQAVGANAVPDCDREYVLPYNLEVMLPGSLQRRLGRRGAAIAGAVAKSGNPVLRLLTRRSSSGLTIEPCRDWKKLSDLFHTHRSDDWLTADRSPEYLAWRYGEHSPNAPDIYVFRDSRGHEGWFALGRMVRGRDAQIRARVLMDAVWPRETMSFKTLFPAIARVAAPGTDALWLQPRPGVDYGACSRWLLSRPATTRIFAVPRKGGRPLTMTRMDFVPADGDSAFRISVWPKSF